MTRNITLLSNNDIDGLQLGKSVRIFHLVRTASNRLFLCLFIPGIFPVLDNSIWR